MPVAKEFKDFNFWYKKGCKFLKERNCQEAIDSFDHALEMDPYFFEAWYDKYSAFQKLDKHLEAAYCLQKALKVELEAYEIVLGINPQDSNMWNKKGIVLELLGEPEKALESFKIAVKVDPDNDEAQFNRVNISVK